MYKQDEDEKSYA